MKTKLKSRIVKLGVVGVDSAKLVIRDPSYIEREFLSPDSKGKSDHAHPIYKHKKDGSLWQFCYGGKSNIDGVNSIKGTYADIIPEYRMSMNDLIQKGLVIETDIDTTPHIPKGEFSYRGISKTTDSENQGGQLNYKLGHEGVAVAFRSGFGDGTYEVFAEIIETESFGERVKKVWIELITDKEFETMNHLTGNFKNN